MGTTKQLHFDEETNAIAEICKALGHPTRIQIMTLLAIKNHRTCGEIVALIPLAQSTISKHLLELKKAHLLNLKNSGKKTIYSIETDKIEELKKYLTHYLSKRVIVDEAETKLSIGPPKFKKEKQQNLKQYNYQFPERKKNIDNDLS
jgi:DNA-binding transcriptional ArsR family regulator